MNNANLLFSDNVRFTFPPESATIIPINHDPSSEKEFSYKEFSYADLFHI